MNINNIGFSGHRDFDLSNFNAKLFIDYLINTKVRFIIGGAEGFDEYIARFAFHYGIPYDLKLPYKSFIKYPDTLVHARTIDYGEEKYKDNSCFFKRNQKIVDEADILIVYWNGEEKGGTWDTIKKARKKDIEIINTYEK